MANYAPIVRSTDPQANQGGYKDTVWFANVDSFLALQKPVAPFTNPGDKLKISTAHTFTSPAGFWNWMCKQRTVVVTTETIGDPGARQLRHTCVFSILGDSASTQDQMQAMLNDSLILLVKEANCLDNDSYVQLGDECVQPEFSVAFDSANNAEGSKTYTVTAVVTGKKYFYTGVVTEAA